MRANRGFTLIELMVVVAITGIVAGLVVWQGRSARQAAGLSGGAYDLVLRIGALKGRALADGREYVLVVTDTADPNGCMYRETSCGRIVTLRNPDPGFSIDGFNPEPPIAGAEWFDDGGDGFLPQNSRFDDVPSAWRPPPPFAAVHPWDSALTATCADGRRCFGLRFRPTGEVEPMVPGAGAAPARAGFAFVLRPVEAPSAAAERRAVFVSFPTGIVKTGAF